MNKYKKKNLLMISSIILSILIIIFFNILKTMKIWTYDMYNIIEIYNKKIITIIENKNLKSFQENNFFYYDTKKYHYVIQEVSRYDDKIILKLKLKNKIKLLKDDKTFLLPKTKETIFSLIIDSWRSKWKN